MSLANFVDIEVIMAWCADLPDGEPLTPELQSLLTRLILPAFSDREGAAEALATALSQRQQRKLAYV